MHHHQASANDPIAAAELAETQAPLSGWVNNAAMFRDADLATAPLGEIGDLGALNVNMAIVGCQVAVQHFVSHARAGSIVNVSSHQAQRPVRGALPYATAKAAVAAGFHVHHRRGVARRRRPRRGTDPESA